MNASSGAAQSSKNATTWALSYSCSACGAVCSATVTGLTPPCELRDQRSVELLRRVRETRTELAQQMGKRAAVSPDPVEELDTAILENQARKILFYATCPRCKARNPEGIAASKREHLTSTAGTFGFFAVVALVSYFVPWVANLTPLIAFILLIATMVAARKLARPVRFMPIASQALFIAVLIALIMGMSRFAFLAPAVVAVRVLIHFRRGDDQRFVDAEAQIRFHLAAYRDPATSR